jgi:hypothetical protein
MHAALNVFEGSPAAYVTMASILLDELRTFANVRLACVSLDALLSGARTRDDARLALAVVHEAALQLGFTQPLAMNGTPAALCISADRFADDDVVSGAALVLLNHLVTTDTLDTVSAFHARAEQRHTACEKHVGAARTLGKALEELRADRCAHARAAYAAEAAAQKLILQEEAELRARKAKAARRKAAETKHAAERAARRRKPCDGAVVHVSFHLIAALGIEVDEEEFSS